MFEGEIWERNLGVSGWITRKLQSIRPRNKFQSKNDLDIRMDLKNITIPPSNSTFTAHFLGYLPIRIKLCKCAAKNKK